MLTILSDQRTTVNVRHLIIKGSSFFVIGRNVTRITDIIHISGNCLQFHVPETGESNTIQFTDHDLHSFPPKERFYHAEFKSIQDFMCSTIIASSASALHGTEETRNIIQRMHYHVCIDSNYNYIKFLLYGMYTI